MYYRDKYPRDEIPEPVLTPREKARLDKQLGEETNKRTKMSAAWDRMRPSFVAKEPERETQMTKKELALLADIIRDNTVKGRCNVKALVHDIAEQFRKANLDMDKFELEATRPKIKKGNNGWNK